MSILLIIASLIGGGLLGFIADYSYQNNKRKSEKEKAKKLIQEAEKEKEEILAKAQEAAEKERKELQNNYDQKQKYVQESETKLRDREVTLDKRSVELDQLRQNIENKSDEIEKIKEAIRDLRQKQEDSLERIARMNKEEAEEKLLQLVEKENKETLVKKHVELDHQSDEEIQMIARSKLATVMCRLSSEITGESVIYTVSIPNEEMKGRLIGKEGRNIQAFEKAIGVDLLIDETPDSVVLSCFDPVRREIARVALEKLIQDGRIHPTKIEESITKAEEEVNIIINKAGEQAAVAAHVPGLPNEILKVLGRLKFRTSYGQNQLEHSIEVANIAGVLASEIGANAVDARKAALLHDIGKSVSEDVPGPHHHISAQIAKRYGLSEEIIHAILAHHDDIEPKTITAWIVRAADSISGSRPGARRGTYEQYVERLRELESIACNVEGVERAFAIQAGREVRVLVMPDVIDDLGIIKLAKQIAKKIEEEMQYPGQIKVNVIRESRAVEYAK